MTTTIRLRAAREADVPAVEAVVAAAFAPFVARTGIRPAPLTTDWRTVVSAAGLLVAVRRDHVVGVLERWPHPDHVLVETIAVAPAAQGTGVGALLLAAAEALALESGSRTVRLFTNEAMTANLAWYARRGFVETARRTEDGFRRVHLEKRLR